MDNLDRLDRAILEELQKDCRQSTRELAKKLHAPATTIHLRIKKMVQSGVIKGFSVILDAEKIGLPTTAFILVRRFVSRKVHVKSEHIGELLAKLPETEDVYVISGEYDAILKVRGKNERDIGKWVVDNLWNIPEVGRTLTFFAFHKSKDTNILPLKSQS